MKKISLMTWFSYHNYGTVLQAVALFNMIKKIGCDPLVINYIPKQKEKKIYMSRIFLYIQKCVNLLISGGTYSDRMRDAKFDEFINTQLVFTGRCVNENDLKNLCADFDAFICGSDQIWSPVNFDAHYFLDFVHTKKKISYGPSMGVANIDDKMTRNDMSKLIAKFDRISVREKRGAEIIHNICGREAILVLDPTLLFSATEWIHLLGLDTHTSEREKEKYIFCYFLGCRSQNWSLSKRFCRDKKMTLRMIPRFKRDKVRGYELLNGVGPLEFIQYIRNADFVLTDSFHGVLFSIIFEKKFYVYERFAVDDDKNQNIRIYNILQMFGLEDRLIRKSEDFKKAKPLDYNEVNKIVLTHKLESIEYLKKSLKEI